MGQKFTDIIGDEYKTWSNEGIIFDAGTGSGKTYFILHTLAAYAKENNKNILYLCNRKLVKEQVSNERDRLNHRHITIMTYQGLQELLAQQAPPKYDYIVADEIHYLLADSYNRYTDIAGNYLVSQKKSAVIYMSATANILFDILTNNGYVKKDRRYTAERNYNYVSNVFLYERQFATDIINKILEDTPDEKIVFFCNTIQRLEELYAIYGEKAYYMFSSNNKSSKIPKEVIKQGKQCIATYANGHKTFDKRILFTTTVLDNGVDLIDPTIKHIFTEILDIDSMLQSLGRKRAQDDNDKCNFYICHQTTSDIQRYYNYTKDKLLKVRWFQTKIDDFLLHCEKNRDFLKNYPVFYIGKGIDSNGKTIAEIKINNMMYLKYQCDERRLSQIAKEGYYSVLEQFFGELKLKAIEPIQTRKDYNSQFINFIKTHCNIELYKGKEDRNELVRLFEQLKTGAKSSTMVQINKYIKEKKMPYLIQSIKNKKQDANRDKYYWIISKI